MRPSARSGSASERATRQAEGQAARKAAKQTATAASRRALQLGAAATLAVLAAGYLFTGFQRLATDAHFLGVDYRYRWMETRLVASGQDPYVVYAEECAAAIAAHPTPPHGIRTTPGWPPAAPSYPPWGFAYGMVIAPPFVEFGTARLWFCLLNLASLVILALWAYAQGQPRGRLIGVLYVVAALAFIPHLYALTHGQYGILISGFLAASLLLAERRKTFAAGVFCGLALLKPHLAAFFAVSIVLARDRRAVAGMLAPLLAGSLLTWVLTGSAPWTMITSMVRTGLERAHDSYGLLSVIDRLGHEWEPARTLLAVSVGFATFLVLNRLRSEPLEVRFGIAACAGLLWTYHKPYDSSLLIFPAAALARRITRLMRPEAFAFALVFVPQVAMIRMRDRLSPEWAILETAGLLAAFLTLARSRAAAVPPPPVAEQTPPETAPACR